MQFTDQTVTKMPLLKQTSSFQDSKDIKKSVLPISFYEREDVVQIAKDLLGKVLVSNSGGVLTAGIICETEAYAGIGDKASHAYSNRRTKRTEVMYGPAGFSYVYLCYGIHHLFNVVCNKVGVPHAVLVRNVLPIEGLDFISERRGLSKESVLSTGPGTMCQALGINLKHNTISLQGPSLSIEDRGITISNEKIQITPRIGIAYAGEDALLPYRFIYNP